MLRVALAGAGLIARLVHLPNLAALPGVEVVGVADPDEARAREAAAPFPAARAHASAEAMLDAAAPDALLVCAPPFARGDLLARAASRGVHLYVEKPAALTLADARRDLAAVEAAGVVAALGHMWRTTSAARAMAAALRGTPGEATAITGRLLNGPPGPAWSFDAALSGGLLVEFGSHLLDALLAVGGPVAEVSVVGANVTPDPDGKRGPDTALLALRFASGAVGTAQITWAHHGAAWDVLALTPRGPLHWHLGPERLEGPVATAEPDLPPEGTPWHGFGGPSWRNAMAEFLDAARARDPAAVACTLRDGANTLALALAAREAISTGRAVAPEPV